MKTSSKFVSIGNPKFVQSTDGADANAGNLPVRQGLWRQSLDENTPQPVKGFEELRIFQFLWSFDGKSLAYTVAEEQREIVLVENFQ